MVETFSILLPQTVLGVLACLFFLGGSFPICPKRWGPLALGAIALAAGALAYSSTLTVPTSFALNWAVSQSALAIGFQWCCLAMGALYVLAGFRVYSEKEGTAEFYGLLLLILCGMLTVSAANDLILMFLGLELISIPTYILLYIGRRDLASQEAATKYFLLSVLSAAILLYGFAFLYGLTGSTQLGVIHRVLVEAYQPSAPGVMPSGGSVLGLLALVLIFAGLGFKMTAVPFHFYAPDVYQGTSAFNAGLLSVAPKAAGFIALIRIASESMVGFESSGERIALILAAITMTGGNCMALLQTNIRRMLAYSGIAHAGYMLIGIAVGFWDQWNPAGTLAGGTGLPGGVQATLLYLLAYCLASVGLFAVLIYLPRPGKQIEHIDDLTGLVRSQPVMAIAAALCLFSMAGIPPLPGFWGKLAVFSSALSVRTDVPGMLPVMHTGFTVLAIVGVLNAAIGAVYYLRVISTMFLNEPLSTPQPSGGKPAYISAAISTVLLVVIGLLPQPLFNYLNQVDVPARTAAVTAPVDTAALAGPTHDTATLQP